ncbi:hypothetical protein GGR54DRAFT_69737 [Hypoxylon sp. NC1633]|nr:hypothetical protein GGR54DRAFT_69737 [Hypoxylon sp. NC1633]
MSAILQSPGGLFKVPEISQPEIDSFHNTHFSNAAVELFDAQFLQPENTQNYDQHYEEYEEYYEDEDDGLGYYPDGVKRTLTDEQIEIFRHSELEALSRIQINADKLKKESATMLQKARNADAAEPGADPLTTASPPLPTAEGENRVDNEHHGQREVRYGSEDGEIETDTPKPTKAEARRLKKQRSRQRKHEQRRFNPEKKPDLRKRTWDVVEAGMDSLHYDDAEVGQGDSATTHASQRRQISYDD